MLKKAFQVQVELEIQAVSCPGVWLCPSGKVSLQLYMMGSAIQTTSAEPIFPMCFQEKFIFYKTFFSVRKLIGLHKVLGTEILYAELIQWQNCEVGNVLATFQTSLSELLFPGQRDGTMAGVDIDLLMEPMKNFPGILAPKIEVSTKLIIEDKICPSEADNTYVVNPQVLPSKPAQKQQNMIRQKKVCHSTKYHRGKSCSVHCQEHEQRPPFVFKRVDEGLINRKPRDMDVSDYCNCKKSPRKNNNVPNMESAYGRSRSTGRSQVFCMKKEPACDCGIHTQDDCAVCSKYKYYFESTAPSIKSKKRCSPTRYSPRREPKREGCSCDRHNNNITKLCNYSPKIEKLSLAEKIHNRLSDTLNQCRVQSPCMEKCEHYLSGYECDCCSMQDSCTVSSFGDFYKRLYRKSRAKCEKYVNCN